MRHGGKTDDIFEILLNQGNQGSIHHVDRTQSKNQRSPHPGTLGHEHNGNSQRREDANFHFHPRQEHGHGGRCCHMTIRRPAVEGEDTSQDAKSQENEWEPEPLEFRRETRFFQFQQVKRAQAGAKI